MLLLDARAARVVWTVAVFAGAAVFLYALRHVILLFVLALFFAYLIFPLVRLVQRPGRLLGRTAAIVVVYLLILGALVGVGFAVGPPLRDEVTMLTQRIPEMSQRIESGEWLGQLLGRRGVGEEQIRAVDQFLRAHTRELIIYTQKVLAGLLGWLAGAWVVVLVPIFAFFIVKDAEHFRAGVETLLEDPHRRLWRGIADDIHALLARYVRALVLLALVTFVVWSIVFLVSGTPYPLVLAAVGGALEFVPVLGPLAAGVVVVGVALFSGYGHPWALALFVLLWRGVQDYATSPLVMGRGVELHPALIIFGVIAGGEIAGVTGMFLSVPAIAALRVLWRRLGSAP
ncbi:MAG: AI-2E family transporter [Candidatus Rokubacteria bacterium]|nr:AI-2E family transporter [Candidatus Rokubacteria bacterium]MBI3826378.1 AI-2E family transporter [Candidatus Rokubacteria bacterium]